MSAEELAGIAGAILSLLFSYVPGLSDLYGKLEPTEKRLVMAGLLVAVAASVFGLSCGHVLSSVTCDQAGVWGLVKVLLAALVSNQGTYLVSPQKARAAQG